MIAGAQEASQKTIVLSGIVNNPTHSIMGAVVEAAYERAGIPMEIRWVPAKRALSEANRGDTDGDIGRIEGTEKVWENLVPVPTSYMTFTARAYSNDVHAVIRDWPDLKPYRVGIIRGVRYAEIGTENMKRRKANTPVELMRLLVGNHVDVVIAADEVAHLTIIRKFSGEGIDSVSGPLYEAPIYHFLHRRNENLIGRLDAAIREMVDAGEIDLIRRQALDQMAASF